MTATVQHEVDTAIRQWINDFAREASAALVREMGAIRRSRLWSMICFVAGAVLGYVGSAMWISYARPAARFPFQPGIEGLSLIDDNGYGLFWVVACTFLVGLIGRWFGTRLDSWTDRNRLYRQGQQAANTVADQMTAPQTSNNTFVL